MKWQPIETAPADTADGEPPEILVWVANGGVRKEGAVAFGRVYIGERTHERRPQASGYSGDWKITHWMPLPEPPET